MLTPSERWSWTYCPQRDRLLLDISEQAQFCSHLTSRQLTVLPVQQRFAIAEAELFWQFMDSMESLPLSDEQRLEFCLHALSYQYLQLQAHKSWYFPEQVTSRVQFAELVSIVGTAGRAVALVIAEDTDCVSCLMLSDVQTLAGKTIKAATTVRLLRNRVSPLNQPTMLARSA
ncbi:cell division protein ZapC domain-containing protein [Arsukibacterium sp.]|uniref:cell division protein ZapC domain-containing protein n=1 Tax=Arsukibacterium sp. TaxID=1977258 RepID=UPI00299D10BE|nr:cell division protein ZapC domain-containing protein [Arsukibacterium sp.]MDX1677566.1 cell division protein ZapC [Arsukibacterium sp.]